MESIFYYPVTLHQGNATGSVIAPWVSELPLATSTSAPDPSVVVLNQNDSLPDGMYLWNGTQWRLAIPYTDIAFSVISGSSIELFYQVTQDYTGLPSNAKLWKNSVAAQGTTVTAGTTSTWGATYVAAANVGDVTSVNNVGPDGTGNVSIAIADIPGLQAALDNAGQVKTVDGQSPDGNGNIVVKAQDVAAGTATSIINSDGSTTGTIVLRKIAAGTGVAVALDGNGNIDVRNTGVLTVNSTAPDGSGNVVVPAYTLPTATAAVKGGVLVPAASAIAVDGSGNLTLKAATTTLVGGVKQGTGATIAGDGTLTVPTYVPTVQSTTATGGNTLIGTAGAAGVGATIKQLVAGTNITLTADANGVTISAAGGGATGVTQVTSEGTGTSLVDNDGTTGGIAILKSIAAGSNITITPAGDGKTLTITANQTITPATTSAIGGVIVKAGLAVDGSGNLSLAAPVGVNLGGVKAGTGISIAADGTISSTGAVASVSGQTGTVVVQATNNNGATGTSLISDSGSTTANIKLKTIVAGTGITLAADPNGNLQINSSATGGVSSITAGTSGALTGAITFTAGQSISLSNTGNSIQINGTGVPEAPNDGNQYARQNMGWTVLPSLGSAITSVTGQTGTGAVLLVEASPPANSAIIKSLVAGNNVTITENAGLLTITAALPAGTVATVNSKSPDGSGNVLLAASDVGALPILGGTMGGDITMANHKVTGLPTPTVAGDAVPLSFIQGLVIDGGVIG